MNNMKAVKVFFPVGKFIILYSICFLICDLLIHSKMITAVLATLESTELYYGHVSCVNICTPTAYTHAAHTHAQEQIREGKTPLKALILLLHEIWKFCWKPLQKLPSTGASIGKGIGKVAAAGQESIHSLISKAISKKQS